MLPNTKKIFDKWLKLWEAMLFLYPICGLLIGGGNFASALILNTTGQNGGAATVFTALIIGIVPIFFIPTMLKGAFAAMGSIGNTISGFGKRLSSGATSRIKNAESYKNAQERSAERQKRKAAQRRAGVYIDKDGNVKQSRRPSARLRRKVAGTWVGGKLGMDTNMGKNTKAFLQQEAARRGNSESMDLDSANAVFAGVQAKEAKQRIEDQETLITNGKARLKNGNTVNASSADSVALYHQEMLEEAHRAKKSGDNAGYAAAMDRAKAAQNILSKTDSGRGHVQANLEGAISAGHTSGLSEAAGHLLDNYGDKYKTANRGAHGLISDLAVATTDAQGNLTVAEKDSSGKLVDVKLADKVSSRTYDTKGTDKYTAETLAGADESALERLENSFTGKAGAPTMSAAQKAEIAKTAYEALNNPNIHVKPEVENRLRTLSAGYTPPTSPEEAHRTRLEAQNQEIIDQQRSVAQTNHQIFAQRQGKNPVTGTYPVPNGYTADPSRPGIYTDGKGSTYNSTNNTFS